MRYEKYNLAEKVISWVLFPSLWIKLIFAFSVGEEYLGNVIYSQLYSVTDIVILSSIFTWWCLYPISQSSKKVVYLVLVLFVLNVLTFLYNETNFLSQLSLFLKLVIPILFLMALLEYARKYPDKILCLVDITMLVVVACTVYGFIFFEMSNNRNVLWMPAYFSGVHTTSYLWVSVFFALIWKTKNTRGAVILWIAFFLFIAMSWGVRTAQAALLLFSFPYILSSIRAENIKASVYMSILFLIIIALVYVVTEPLIISSLDWWSSGRLSMYSAKLEQLAGFGIAAVLFGKGVGADLISTDIWWWVAKGAHNDYLTLLVEQGMLFLICVFLLLGYLFKSFKGDRFLGLVVIVYAFTSMVSNGFMVRPLAAYVIFLSACVYVAIPLTRDRPNN